MAVGAAGSTSMLARARWLQTAQKSWASPVGAGGAGDGSASAAPFAEIASALEMALTLPT